MRYAITTEGHIRNIAEDAAGEVEGQQQTFATEEELKEITRVWPLKRLVELWNHLAGVLPVRRFENRQIAIARLWQAIAAQKEGTGSTVASRRTSAPRWEFRDGSKAAQVCALLYRQEGATLSEIRSATGWQAHTVRGFISRNIAKQGRRVRSLEKDGERVYRIKA